MTGFLYSDGGRKAAGYSGSAGDCVTRAIAIASGKPYATIYAALAKGTGAQRASKRAGKQSASARNGIHTGRKWFKDFMAGLGFRWVPTMSIGSGTRVHLDAAELPKGRLVVAVSKHYTAVVDGTIYDTHDPRRSKSWLIEPDHGQELKPKQHRNENGVCTEIGGRAVYGYWILEGGADRQPSVD